MSGEIQKDKVILGLDLSTSCTGFAVMNQLGEVIDRGRLKTSGAGMSKLCKLEKTLERMLRMSNEILEIIYQYNPDVIVIEEITGSVSRMSQKTLDGFHWVLLNQMRDYLPKVVFYDVTGANGWRNHLNLRLSEADKLHNKEAKKLNKQIGHGTTKIPKIGPKHLAVRYVNNTFNLDFNVDKVVTDGDEADALAMTHAYIKFAYAKGLK